MSNLNWAREQMQEIDHRAGQVPLYISRDEDPVAALRKIRAFLEAEAEHSGTVALAVAGLERILDQFKDLRCRTIWERPPR